jgi:hypothetical protein
VDVKRVETQSLPSRAELADRLRHRILNLGSEIGYLAGAKLTDGWRFAKERALDDEVTPVLNDGDLELAITEGVAILVDTAPEDTITEGWTATFRWISRDGHRWLIFALLPREEFPVVIVDYCLESLR